MISEEEIGPAEPSRFVTWGDFFPLFDGGKSGGEIAITFEKRGEAAVVNGFFTAGIFDDFLKKSDGAFGAAEFFLEADVKEFGEFGGV